MLILKRFFNAPVATKKLTAKSIPLVRILAMPSALSREKESLRTACCQSGAIEDHAKAASIVMADSPSRMMTRFVVGRVPLSKCAVARNNKLHKAPDMKASA